MILEQMKKKRMGDNIELRKKIDNFILKYDPVKTLFYISKDYQFNNKICDQQPVLNFLFNLYLKRLIDGRSDPSQEDIDNLIKNSTEYLHSFKDLIFMEEENKLMRILKQQCLISLINPEIYEHQFCYKFEKIFPDINEDFKEKFGFSPLSAFLFSDLIIQIYMERFSKNEDNYLLTESEIEVWLNKKRAEKLKHSDQKEMNDELSSYLNNISIEFGQGNQNYTSLLDEDFSWKKPIAKTQNGYLAVNLRQIKFGLFVQIEELLKKTSSLKEKYAKLKSEYAENLSFKCFQKIFGKEKVYKNIKYQYENKEYEVDTLIEYDSKIILVEVKSGNVLFKNKPNQRLKQVLKKAYEQTQKASEYISNTNEPSFVQGKMDGGKILKIKKNDHLKILPICISIENLMAITQNLKYAKLDDFFHQNQYPWAVNLLELEVISDHIKYPSLFLHYIESRLTAQSNESQDILSTDELSYFGLYLKDGPAGGFNFRSNYSMALITPDFLEIFDNFYNGENKKPPQLNIDHRLEKFIQEFEFLYKKGIVQGHSEIFNWLLKSSSNDLEKLFDEIENCIEKTKKDGKPHKILLGYKDYGISFHSDRNVNQLEKEMICYSKIKKYDLKKETWIGLGTIVDSDDKWFINKALFFQEPYKYNTDMERALEEFKRFTIK